MYAINRSARSGVSLDRRPARRPVDRFSLFVGIAITTYLY
jgi:hypothetical protein